MNGSEVRIRRARSTDREAVFALGQEVAAQPLLVRYGVSPAGLGRELAELCLQPEPPLLLAAGEAGLCGFARYQERGTLGPGGYLQLIALLPGSEGRGTGARLLAAVEDAVRPASRALFLLTTEWNSGAQRFYERHGYALVGRLPDYVRPGFCELLYWKALRG